MAETPEGRVKRWLYGSSQKPGRLYHYFPGAYVYKPPGGFFGSTGAPDCLLCWRGIFVGIEVKAEGNTPTTLQLKHLRSISQAGGVAAVLIGKDDAKLELVRKAVLDRIKSYELASTDIGVRLAQQVKDDETVPAPDGDGGISAAEQESV